MGLEFELKYRGSERAFAEIQKQYGPFSATEMETTYYDTPDGDFSARRWTLRRRFENGTGVCTLKTPAPGHARGEWEVSCDCVEKAVPLLLAAGAPKELEALARGPFVSLCGARFTRLAATVAWDGCAVELALDRGLLTGGTLTMPFLEIEVELKSGSEAAATAFAQHLAAALDLNPESQSKHHRALLLARNDIHRQENPHGKS